MRAVPPKTVTLLADKGYEADWRRRALNARRIKPCILSHIWPDQGLAAYPHAIRMRRTQFDLHNLHRRRSHLTAMITDT